jgi:hypothetical protein
MLGTKHLAPLLHANRGNQSLFLDAPPQFQVLFQLNPALVGRIRFSSVARPNRSRNLCNVQMVVAADALGKI